MEKYETELKDLISADEAVSKLYVENQKLLKTASKSFQVIYMLHQDQLILKVQLQVEKLIWVFL